MNNLVKLIDREGNSLQLPPRVYEDKSCMVYSDNCWVNKFHLNQNLISFMYEDGRIKTLKLDEAQNFSKKLKPYSDDPKYFETLLIYIKNTQSLSSCTDTTFFQSDQLREAARRSNAGHPYS